MVLRSFHTPSRYDFHTNIIRPFCLVLWVGLLSMILAFPDDYTQLFYEDSRSMVAALNFPLQYRDLCHQQSVLIEDIKKKCLVQSLVVHLI